jgi:hypothetical protein
MDANLAMNTVKQHLDAVLRKTPSERLLGAILGFVLLYSVFWLGRAAYRLTIHPLSSVPGPRWAAVSCWWLYREEKSRHVEQRLRDLHRAYGETNRCVRSVSKSHNKIHRYYESVQMSYISRQSPRTTRSTHRNTGS